MNKRVFRALKRIMGITIFVVLLAVAGYAYWFTHRERPVAIASQELFQGVSYTRDILDIPRPMNVHIIKIDLKTDGLKFLVTPDNGRDGFEQSASTVSEFADVFGVQIAVNGGFFQPFHELGPISYYPHEGNGVNLNGISISEGDVISDGIGFAYEALYISADNQIAFEKPTWDVYNAISGDILFIQQGQIAMPDTINEYYAKSNPRTAIATNADASILWLIVIDGRQPNYSEGATLQELADIVFELGAYTALNLDGGGSTTMVIEDGNGQLDVLNSPIHTRIPGRERPIANHLGIYAQPLENVSATQSTTIN